MTAQGFKDQGELVPDNLIAGEYPRVSKMVTITGGIYTRGTVLGKITASGKYTIVTSAASDGSKTPEAILAEDVDATTDKEVVVYLTGEFNSAALKVGTGLTIAGIDTDCRTKSIFLKNNQEA